MGYLADIVGPAMSGLVGDLGESATHVRGGVETVISFVPTGGARSVRQVEDLRRGEHAAIEGVIAKTALASLVVNSDQVEYGGVRYAVTEVLADVIGYWEVRLSRVSAGQVTGRRVAKV